MELTDAPNMTELLQAYYEHEGALIELRDKVQELRVLLDAQGDELDRVRRVRHALLELEEEFGAMMASVKQTMAEMRAELARHATLQKQRAELMDAQMDLTDDRFDLNSELIKGLARRVSVLEEGDRTTWEPDTDVKNLGALQDTARHVTELSRQATAGQNVNVHLQLGSLMSVRPTKKSDPPLAEKAADWAKIARYVGGALIALISAFGFAYAQCTGGATPPAGLHR